MRHFVVRACAAAFLLPLAWLTLPAHAADDPGRRAITHEDLWLMQRIGALAASPDGRWFVASVAEPAYDEDKKRSDLWIMASDGSSAPRRLTASRSAEGDPAWSPDSSRIAFSAKRDDDDAAQIYVIDLRGGEAQRVTNWAGGAKAPQFSPDGASILFIGSTFPGAVTQEDNAKAAAERKARKYNARSYDAFPIRHWDRWLDELRPSVLVQPLGGSSPARDLLAASALRKEPGFGGSLGNEGESIDATWTPDGKGVVFAATTVRDEGARAPVFASLWYVGLDGGEPRRLTTDNDDYSAPQFTRDGRTLLAKVQPASDRWVYVSDRLARWSWPSFGERKLLTNGVAESVGQYLPAPDSRSAYFVVEQAGHERLFNVPLTGGTPSQVGQLDSGSYARIAVGGTAKSPAIAAIWSSANSPHEVGRVDPATGRWTALSAFNSGRAAAIDLQPAETFWFTSQRGRRIHNMIVKPPGFDPKRKYPLFVVIHGGPHVMWKDEFFLRWNYQLLASPGYVVLLTNYSGSTGFGEEFARGIQGDPLAGPADEINEAADQAIARFPFIDGSRQVAGGASYGGHLTNWLAVSTDRYKALVSHAGLFDLRTQWTTSDVVYHRERNVGGPAWDESLVLWREQSPFYRSEKLKTPILLTFGERDYRVPLNNGIEFWTVLQRQQVPSRLVVFPDENHWILKGENSRYFYQQVHEWVAKYL